MAFTVGLQASIAASAASTDLGYLLNTSTKPYTADISVSAESFDGTGFDATNPVAMDMLLGIKDWTLSFTGKFPKTSPVSGHEGLVTLSGGGAEAGHTTGTHGWTLNATASEHDHTGFASTPPEWKTWASGLYSFSGTFNARADDTTPLAAVGVTTEATFRLKHNSGGNADLLKGDILITGRSAPFDVNGTPVVTYSWVGDGNFEFDGDSSLFDVSAPGTPDALTRPAQQAITLTHAGSGTTQAGTAFLTSWSIGANIGSPVEFSATCRGTGALTDA